ncbi:hypothetical protein C2845_PM05G11250 [Panicum miliaceum]|uniref:Uncharacterized protein n=1 Tax=Panicum miliaceum TaxID=4540 RepID=A0A3L6SYJ5_PANMI|nr:hypothetical protein C2845_PM05G11250 [Panicum miliaceum]
MPPPYVASSYVLSLLLLFIPAAFLLALRLIPPRTLPAIVDANETEDLALFRRVVLLFVEPTSTASAARLAKNRSRGGRKHLCLPPAMCFSPCLHLSWAPPPPPSGTAQLREERGTQTGAVRAGGPRDAALAQPLPAESATQRRRRCESGDCLRGHFWET